LDLSRFVDVVARQFLLIVAATVLAAGSAYVVSNLLPRQYEAQAQVVVGSLTETSPDQLTAYERLAQTYAALTTSSLVVDRIVDRLALHDDPEELASRITVRVPTGQPILRIVARASSASGARALADAVAAEVLELATPPEPNSDSLASVVQPATEPNGASSPRVFLNTLVAGVLGFGISLGLALLVAVRGDKRQSPEW
jgi:capsular polysaccharide biosynthesis protein